MPIAIVTGAGSGIGRAVTEALIEAGYRVTLTGRSRERLDWAKGVDGTLIVPGDVRDPESVREIFDETIEAFGRVDILFNNAGIFPEAASIGDIDDTSWLDVVATNLTGAFWCTREAFRAMRKQNPRGGRIINNGSISAHAPRPLSAAYTATKHAITGLTKSTSLDGRAFDIACGQIDIGNAATDMASQMADGVPQADGSVRPEPTFDTRHVADAVVHMAGLPLDANIQFMTIMATKMPFIGRG